MGEASVDIPTSWWERLRADKRRLAAVVAAAIVALTLLGVFVVWPLLDPAARGGRDTADLEIPPIDNGSQAGTRTPGSDAATGAAEPGTDRPGDGDTGGDSPGTGDPGADDPATSPSADPRRAPYIAYRLRGVIMVASESGADPVEVAISPDGVYALSPDGRTLALVEHGELVLITVAGGARRTVAPASPDGLAWQADSAALYFTRIAEDSALPEVWRAVVGGGAPALVVQAGPPCVASDDTLVAPSAPLSLTDTRSSSVWVVRPGKKPAEVRVRGRVAECGVEAGLVAYAIHTSGPDDEPGTGSATVPEIWTMRVDGGSQRRLLGPPATPRPFGYANLKLSPDGTHLLYAEVGDDGYSRASIVPVTGGTPLSLTVRRDTYPVGWSADGRSVFFVEGNAFQGEPTSLMRAGIDGTGRRVIVEGAQR